MLGDRSDSLQIRLPFVLKSDNARLVQVRFRSAIFLNGTVFRASIGNAEASGVWQRVDSGDATFLTSSHRMTVSVSGGEDIIGDVKVHPNPFTPNGDGINDAVDIEFTVFKINVPRDVTVTLCSLGGEQVHSMSQRRFVASGRYCFTWTGEDEGGRQVPPGVYLCRIEVDADAESARSTVAHRTICVAY